MLLPSDKNDFLCVDNLSEYYFENIKCIHKSEYENDSILKTAFNLALNSKLRKILMICTGSLSQKRLRLLEQLKMEHKCKVLKLKIEHVTLDEIFLPRQRRADLHFARGKQAWFVFAEHFILGSKHQLQQWIIN